MTNKLRYFIANWKMYGDLKSLKSINKVIKFTKSSKKKNYKLIYCPPYTLLFSFLNKIKKSNIDLGAQDIHHDINNGAYTGKINAKMIKDIGAKFVIIGHSEIRKIGDNDNIINKKIKSALHSNLKVIFCIGETLFHKRNKLTKKILKNQILKGLKNIKLSNQIIIAYEPVWSIGTGLIPKNFELSGNLKFIKSVLSVHKNSKKNTIIYGGSVNPKNIIHLNMINEIDGYLIGGASQDSKKLIDIVKKSVI
tara:strand:+ start:374 stop:1126 length:753 start_codon:yes stop_codon:yes gene_type:complete